MFLLSLQRASEFLWVKIIKQKLRTFILSKIGQTHHTLLKIAVTIIFIVHQKTEQIFASKAKDCHLQQHSLTKLANKGSIQKVPGQGHADE